MWMPIERPAYKDPLCLLDSSSLNVAQETVPIVTVGEIFYGKNKDLPAAEQTPQASQDAPALAPVYNPRQRWVYVSDMTPEEAMLFKQYDFRPNQRATATFHHSMPDPFHEANGWKDCPGRRSMESRILLTFDAESPAAARLRDATGSDACSIERERWETTRLASLPPPHDRSWRMSVCSISLQPCLCEVRGLIIFVSVPLLFFGASS